MEGSASLAISLKVRNLGYRTIPKALYPDLVSYWSCVLGHRLAEVLMAGEANSKGLH
jgi:hypothetical protein